MDATCTIAEHAWRLLDGGRLGALGRLEQAINFIPGRGLSQLMREQVSVVILASLCLGALVSRPPCLLCRT